MPIYQSEDPMDGPPIGPGPSNACGTCGDPYGCDDECNPCLLPRCGRLYFSTDYLMWWTKSAKLPPLATTSPAGTAQADAGVLGADGTTVLFGGRGEEPPFHPGARFTLGFSPDPCGEWAFEASYFFLGETSASFNRTSAAGDPILARPFFNTDTFAQDSAVVAFPGVALDSRLHAALTNEMQSFDLVAREALFRDGNQRVDFLYGYRYARFAEQLGIDQVFTSGPDNVVVPVGSVVRASDAFAADNEFHGAELGISAHTQYYRWSLEGWAKVAVGGTRSRVDINGVTSIDGVLSPGGLLAQPTNIGRYTQSNFSVIPEVGLKVGCDLTPRLRATFGYSLLYWSNVARPGDQIDAGRVAGDKFTHINVNPTQFSGGTLVGMPSPQFRFVNTDFWAQGLTFGLDGRF